MKDLYTEKELNHEYVAVSIKEICSLSLDLIKNEVGITNNFMSYKPT